MPSPLPDPATLETRKTGAKAWFESLRDSLCVALETLEDEAPPALYGSAAGRFARTPWSRTDSTVAPYDKYKAWCDEYFYLKHRREPRGIGGIFFDWQDGGDWAADFAFVKDVGRAFAGIYPQIVRRNMATAWDAAERDEQLVRRGR